MANSLSLPIEAAANRDFVARPALAYSRYAPRSLSSVAIGALVTVVSIELDGETGAWLRAVGISEGEHLTVLRRAAFGGPIHVRASSGGEFAIHRALAKAIVIGDHLDDDEESAA